MKDELLAILHDREKGSTAFRKAVDKSTRILLDEIEDKLHKDNVSGEEIMIVPVLRSGVVFLPACIDKFKGVPIGIVAVKCNKKTKVLKLYYKNFPKQILPVVIIVDPILKTGITASVVVDMIIKKGVIKKNIYFLGIIASKDGIDTLARLIPRENIIFMEIDSSIDNKSVISGVNDFGDRYFGT